MIWCRLKVCVIKEKEHLAERPEPRFLTIDSFLTMPLWANHSISLASLVTSVGDVLVEKLTS